MKGIKCTLLEATGIAVSTESPGSCKKTWGAIYQTDEYGTGDFSRVVGVNVSGEKPVEVFVLGPNYRIPKLSTAEMETVV